MVKIVVSDNMRLTHEQEKRLKALGDVKIYSEAAKSDKESLKRFNEAEIICTEKNQIENILYELKDKFISFPFVGMGWLNIENLKKNGIKVSNAPGCNRMPVTEWILMMMIMLSRQLYPTINNPSKEYAGFPKETQGLTFKRVTILGHGNVGKKIGEMCEQLGMEVTYFRRNDDLQKNVENADYIVNCLDRNKDTEGMLDKKFFESLKEAYFISITDQQIYDVNAMKEALNRGNLLGAALDPAGVKPGDSSDLLYADLSSNPKVLITPHLAFNTDAAIQVGNEIMIDNVEAFLKGKQQNIIL